MNISVKTNKGMVQLTDKHFLASGGEGSIYVQNGNAYKLYHDPNKLFPVKKMEELRNIKNNHVIIPTETIYDPKKGIPIGYMTKFIQDTIPLLMLFTKTFKIDNNITPTMVCELVKQLQLIVNDIHMSNCLVVDLNELNVLTQIHNNTIDPWFIDTDSYATPSFKATAIMDSVRDRKVSSYDAQGKLHYSPNIESDWFSWSVLALWVYLNIHPYKGNHKKYPPTEKQKQMDDGISIFHPDVKLPPCVNNFNVIPPRHLDYFKRVHLHGERGIPPLPDSNIPLAIPNQIVILKGTKNISIIDIESYDSEIMSIHNFMGVYYVATKKKLYASKKEIGSHDAQKVYFCNSSDGSLIVIETKFNKTTFRTLTNSSIIGTIPTSKYFIRNNCIYYVATGKLRETSFISFGNKIIEKTKEIENISDLSTNIYDGCIIQNLIGKYYLTFPYLPEKSFTRYIPELDGYRIISAKADKHIVIIIGEKAGKYDRFILIYDKTYSTYSLRKDVDVSFNNINFCVTDNKMCVFLSTDDDLQLFFDTTKIMNIPNPPFDLTMKLFSTPDGVFIINDNSYHQIKTN